MLIGIPAGIFAAIRKNSIVDYAIMTVALLGICLPNFVIGPMLAEFFGAKLRLRPGVRLESRPIHPACSSLR
jgi:oligopeptide transport system permease protein